jgi:4-amino-4-deoxy-L-arabinose transferase-like glycosyltransferase
VTQLISSCLTNDDNLQKVLTRLLLIASFSFTALFLYTISLRIPYPFELEWMEGAFLTQSLWLLKGNQLYVEPTIDFIPFLYTPLYTWLSTALMYVLGVGFWQARLVSVASSIGSAVMVYMIVKRLNGGRDASLIAAGLFLAGYGVTGFYYDVIRVDNLLMFMAAIGFYFAFISDSKRHVVLSALFLSLSFFSKQTGLFYLTGMGFYYLVNKDFNNFLFYCLVCFFFVVIPVIYLHYSTQGWFTFYTYNVIDSYYFIPSFINRLFIPDLTNRFPFLTILTLGYFAYLATKKGRQRGMGNLLNICVVIGIVTSFLMRNKEGGVANCLIPMLFFETILAGTMIGNSDLVKSPKVKSMVMVLLLAQFYVFKYNPKYFVPNQADLETGKKILEYMKSQDDSVWLLDHAYYPVMVGRKPKPHNQALHDVWRTDKPVALSIKRMLEEKKFSKIIRSYQKNYDRLQNYIHQNYYQAELLLPPDDLSFYPKAGYLVRPQYIFLPNKSDK